MAAAEALSHSGNDTWRAGRCCRTAVIRQRCYMCKYNSRVIISANIGRKGALSAKNSAGCKQNFFFCRIDTVCGRIGQHNFVVFTVRHRKIMILLEHVTKCDYLL